MDKFETLLGLDYEAWILLLPASLEQCAVCGLSGDRTFDFWQHGPFPTEAICSACGFEYGGNTFLNSITFEEHRLEWQRGGCQWWSSFAGDRRPDDWDAQKQFKELFEGLVRAPKVPLAQRAPRLVDYYLECIGRTLPKVGSKVERNLLVS